MLDTGWRRLTSSEAVSPLPAFEQQKKSSGQSAMCRSDRTRRIQSKAVNRFLFVIHTNCDSFHSIAIEQRKNGWLAIRRHLGSLLYDTRRVRETLRDLCPCLKPVLANDYQAQVELLNKQFNQRCLLLLFSLFMLLTWQALQTLKLEDGLVVYSYRKEQTMSTAVCLEVASARQYPLNFFKLSNLK